MKPAARARRRREHLRAEMQALKDLRGARYALAYGGVGVQGIAFSDVMHGRLDVARDLGYTVVLRRNFGGGPHDWRAYAIKVPDE